MRTWLAFLLVLAALAAARIPSLDLPLDRDEGEYATLAVQWAAPDGGQPYRDFLQQKPPLVPALYRLAFALAGPTPCAVRGLALAWQLATAAALFGLAFSLAGALPALMAGLLFVLASTLPATQGLSANTEGFMALPLIGGLALLARRQDGVLRGLAAGLLLGAASLAKQSALPALLALPLLLADGWGSRLRLALWLSLGCVLAWVAAAGCFWAEGGILGAARLLYCSFTYNFSYAGQGRSGYLLKAGMAAQGWLATAWPLALLALLGWWQAPAPAARRVAGAFLLAAVLGIGLSGRFYPHYFMALAAPLALAGGLLFAAHGCLARPLGLGLALAALLAWGWSSAPLWRAPDGAARSLRLYGLPNFSRAQAAADTIQRLDPSAGRVWLWGSEAELYFLSGRRPATRFLFHYAFTGEAPPWPEGDLELIQALYDPRVSVAVLAAPLKDAPPRLRPLLLTGLRRNFRHTVEVPGFVIGFRHRPPNR
jgi:4-amino-4-deoxy-L-arabinose transferase-like glycosyltransferase